MLSSSADTGSSSSSSGGGSPSTRRRQLRALFWRPGEDHYSKVPQAAAACLHCMVESVSDHGCDAVMVDTHLWDRQTQISIYLPQLSDRYYSTTAVVRKQVKRTHHRRRTSRHDPQCCIHASDVVPHYSRTQTYRARAHTAEGSFDLPGQAYDKITRRSAAASISARSSNAVRY